MLEKKDYIEYVKNHIREELPDRFRDKVIKVDEVAMNNGSKTVLDVHGMQEGVALRFNLDEFYQAYTKGSSIDLVFAEIRENMGIHPIDIGNIEDKLASFDSVKSMLYAKVCCTEGNEQYLNDRPHTEIGILSALYSLRLEQNEDGIQSIPITNALMDKWNITLSELHTQAVENTAKIMPPMLISIEDVVYKGTFGGYPYSKNWLNEDRIPAEPDSLSMYILSNKHTFYGASALLDDKLMEGIANRFQENYYIIPSSAHEVILLLESQAIDLDNLNFLLRSVNQEIVSPEDRLCDDMLYYDLAQKRMMLAADYQKEQSQSLAKDAPDLKVNQRPRFPKL